MEEPAHRPQGRRAGQREADEEAGRQGRQDQDRQLRPVHRAARPRGLGRQVAAGLRRRRLRRRSRRGDQRHRGQGRAHLADPGEAALADPQGGQAGRHAAHGPHEHPRAGRLTLLRPSAAPRGRVVHPSPADLSRFVNFPGKSGNKER
ncbi:hypothetical protein SBRY_60362 [Actinacidiphila bryophytorum]|uniref:Uncharacterized protein n=1 Tax=Actinacidiphila bryophytorum TaxID=1436133 RepID=A0A9W4H6A2_9ACTN|nr:hypothetical protein SBRY_60362 [Actinacidiphila bryophytorum]